MRYGLLYALFFLINSISWSQAVLSGKVLDDTGESIIGAKIYVKENPKIITKTDLDGNYYFSNFPSSLNQTVVVTFPLFDTTQYVVNISEGQSFNKDFIIYPLQRKLNEVKISAKLKKSNDVYMEKIKLNSATTIDYISAELMKKTGDANVTSAVSRVSGVSTSGGLITVRGIGDRYIKTTLNGSRIPTSKHITNNIKLDKEWQNNQQKGKN